VPENDEDPRPYSIIRNDLGFSPAPFNPRQPKPPRTGPANITNGWLRLFLNPPWGGLAAWKKPLQICGTGGKWRYARTPVLDKQQNG
jgi:hypothetical protein